MSKGQRLYGKSPLEMYEVTWTKLSRPDRAEGNEVTRNT